MAYNVGPRTDHNGAKNGGGYWGHRADAKEESKRIRRIQTKECLKELPDEAETPVKQG